ncbi:hypothetical protein SSX86_031596, partial [Deinandra increscens subsp. villosa]
MAALQAVFLLILLMVLMEAGVCDHLEDQEVKLFLRTVISFYSSCRLAPFLLHWRLHSIIIAADQIKVYTSSKKNLHKGKQLMDSPPPPIKVYKRKKLLDSPPPPIKVYTSKKRMKFLAVADEVIDNGIINPPTPPLTDPASEGYNLRGRMSFSPLPDLISDKKMRPKFKPRVMFDSPITPSVCGDRRRGDPSCRRFLDFGSNAHIETKSTTICTKDTAEGAICKEKEVEKLWKQEHELFKQRVLSFITSMRQLQGNRPFMGWKGSVVDSVVGIIMTQNAADSLSSSAFMSLAAKYPKKIKTESLKDEDHTQVHALDWNAVRTAPCSHIAQAIKRKGMNKRNAERIQNFLNRIHDEKSGLGDLEWLRSAEPEVAKDFFMGIYGLGLKSTECLRLLTLRQHAFPVDTHVSRIVVRLGWVPIEKLPHGGLIHELKEYPMINHVQEYLSHRLSNLDVNTLFELHYQMISFGKVFCTKRKPNCNSCPLKKDCKHFASATTSGRGLPGETTFADPVTPGRSKGPVLEDIEDLSLGPRSQELKVAGRLRTKHRVYELHDSHPLVQELNKRDPDDKNPYLLAIWPTGEKTKNLSVGVEEERCSLKSSGSVEEESVFGTLLVPCRTANQGSFPLDGTFFQINE